METKERRSQGQTLAEDMTLLQRGLQKQNDRTDSLASQASRDCSELRERLAREAKGREAAIASVEQALAYAQDAKDGAPTSVQPLQGVPENAERWRQADEDMERMKRSVTSLQSDAASLTKVVSLIEEGLDACKTRLGATENDVADANRRLKGFVGVEADVAAAREEIKKESSERRAEGERFAAVLNESQERIERVEQQRIKAEGLLRQDVLEVKSGIKKEAGDRELLGSRLMATVREEAQKRDEATDREARLRQEGLERQTEAFQAALREERKAREREDLRIEGGSLGMVGAKGGAGDSTSAEAMGLAMEQRALRQSLADVQDRLSQAESRQRNAEERTVSMLDAIMSGLASNSPEP